MFFIGFGFTQTWFFTCYLHIMSLTRKKTSSIIKWNFHTTVRLINSRVGMKRKGEGGGLVGSKFDLLMKMTSSHTHCLTPQSSANNCSAVIPRLVETLGNICGCILLTCGCHQLTAFQTGDRGQCSQTIQLAKQQPHRNPTNFPLEIQQPWIHIHFVATEHVFPHCHQGGRETRF